VAGKRVPERLEPMVVDILSRILELPVDDQIDVLALAIATWCYARDRQGAGRRDALTHTGF